MSCPDTAVAAVDPVRWRPDELLVPAILAGSATTMHDLAPADRAWVIAALLRPGQCTAEAIADRMRCTVRQVRFIAADPLTAVCRLLQDESEHFADELRLVRDELRVATIELRTTGSARDRYKDQLIRLLDAHLTEGSVGTFVCGCPRTRYNTYVAPKTGKSGCREHRRRAVERHRERLRSSNGQQGQSAHLQPGIDHQHADIQPHGQ